MGDFDWTNKTILVAENENANYIFIEAVLEGTNAHILWAKNGKQAVDMSEQNDNIDVVLMDIKMPEMDGVEATELIKANNQEIPVIAQSAYANDYERDSDMRVKFDAFLAKPYKPNQLISTIQEHF